MSKNLSDELDTESVKVALKKIGLNVNNDSIFIESNLFRQSCAAYRITQGIPLSTNQIEAVHGHLNDDTPRKNIFISSIRRIINLIFKRYYHFEDDVYRNFARQINKLSQKYQFSKKDLEHYCSLYESEADKCKCNQTKRLSFLFGLDIPCVHRIFKGCCIPKKSKIIFPNFKIPNPKTDYFIYRDDDISTGDLQNENEWNQTFATIPKPRNCSIAAISKIFENVISNVVFFTNLKDRNEIERIIVPLFYENKRFPVREYHINPVAVIAVTHYCIKYVEQYIKKNHKDKRDKDSV
jgi:hypothetical protein